MAGAYAFCDELKRIVTIDEARREYLSCENPPDRFDFFCPDEGCCQSDGSRTRITGANYRKSATEQPQYKTPYFRDWDEHHTNCVWEQSRKQHQSTPLNETRVAKEKREARQKITDFIEVFNPTAPQDTVKSDISTGVNNLSKDESPRKRSDSEKQNEFKEYLGKTTSTVLERLVDTFIQIDHELGQNGLKAHELEVTGVGILSYRDYFKPIKFANAQTTNRVLYGQAEFVRSYGTGFLFRFYQKIDRLPVTLYASPALVNAYRYRKYITDIVFELIEAKKANKESRVTIYAIGQIEKQGNTLSLIVDDLRHFCIKLPTETDQTSPEALGVKLT
ncbi:MAG: hypothetical protein CTY12_01060 [Methylotenera sp.]|nr:MAG: hypothetical protein CTY12_01060 [Methylotenera sp.]